MRLSQDAEWALRHRARHTRPYQQKKVTSWLLLGLVAVFLLAIVAVLIVGCNTSTGPELTGSTWQCKSAPHIHISLIDHTDTLAYCEVFTHSEVGSMSLSVIEFANMINDGHWQRVPDREPLLGPPPPSWNVIKISDRPKYVRINGSTQVRVYEHQSLPSDKQINIGGGKEVEK